MCYWKYPGNVERVRNNDEKNVIAISKAMFKARGDKEKLGCLIRDYGKPGGLFGVQVRTASALLALTDPENYGVFDFRVWNLLEEYHVNGFGVHKDREDYFSVSNYISYLELLRRWRERFDESLNITIRAVERTLYREALLNRYRELNKVVH